MKSYNRLQSLFLTLSAIASTSVMAVPSAQAVTFEEQRVDQNQFAVVAVPFGHKEHRLEIIEQVAGKQQCWHESGAAPAKIDMLLLDFDHTDSCRRIINTNGYTLRLDGDDDLVSRIVKIVQDRGELKLVAFHKDLTKPSIEIGSTNGLTNGAMKIVLNPGWQITKRIYQGQTVNHLYLSGDSNSSIAYKRPASPSTNTASQTTQSPQFDTRALVNGVEKLYTNVVSPILKDLASERTNSQQ
ncbi:MAG: DUF3747 domain-containing protein [Cyanobacteria bacterium J06600_6]